jgi:hypothetical protein
LAGATNADFSSMPPLPELQALALSKSTIKSLGYVTQCVNVETVDVADTQVQDLSPLSSLRKLKSLDVSRCPIVDFRPVSDCKQLTKFVADGTAFRDLSIVSELGRLQILSVNDTKVIDLAPVGGAVVLEALSATNCGIKALEIKPTPKKLIAVSLGNNPIGKIDFGSGWPALSELDLSGVQISDMLPFAVLPSLRDLRLEQQKLVNLDKLLGNQSLSINGRNYREWAAPYFRDLIFLSYSHEDEKWFNLIEKVLRPVPEHLFVWSDRRITPGSKWRDEINVALSKARIAILLVSRAFLGSKFIEQIELPTFIKAAADEQVRIFWIPVDHCLFSETPLSEIQAVFDPKRPLTVMPETEAEEALVQAAQAIIDAYRTIGPLRPAPR